MLVNFNQELMDVVSDKALEDAGTVLTLRIVAMRALVTSFKGEENLAGEEKVKRWELALRLKTADPVEVSVEEVVKIKEVMNKLFSPAIIGPAFKMFKDAEVTKEK